MDKLKLANYGSDDDYDDSPPPRRTELRNDNVSSRYQGHQGYSRNEMDVNYDEVQMDMSEDSKSDASKEDSPSPPPAKDNRSGRRYSKGDSRKTYSSYNRSRREEDEDSKYRNSSSRREDDEDKYRSSSSRRDEDDDKYRSSRRDEDDDKYRSSRRNEDEDKYRGCNRRDEDEDKYRDGNRRDEDEDKYRGGNRRDEDKYRSSNRRDEDNDDKYRGSRRDDKDKDRSSRRDRYSNSSSSSSSNNNSSRSREKRSRSPRYRNRRSSSRERGSSSSSKSRRFDRTSNKMAQLEKLGIEIKAPDCQFMSPSDLQRSTEEQKRKGETTAGGENRFFMPGITGRFREQIERRKMLWQKKEPEQKRETIPVAVTAPSAGGARLTASRVWETTTFAQDTDGKVANKFKRLMGIRGTTDEPKAATDVLKKQEEMFTSMEAQYEVARTATHTMRGVGLGFGSFQR